MANYLYVLCISKGMPSMGRGKTAAHAAHAANHFTWNWVHRIDQPREDVIEWHEQANGFGTTIALDAGAEEEMMTKLSEVMKANFIGGVVVDPTYPYFTDVEILKLIDPAIHTADPVAIDDRRVLCHRKQVTAAYVFGDKEALAPFLGGLSLLSNDLPGSR